jgi:imidazolonepropionase-like amidohydrolase
MKTTQMIQSTKIFTANRVALNVARVCVTAAALLALTASAETVVLTHAKVVSQSAAGTLSDASVVISDGVIKAMGNHIDVPAGAREINVKGGVVTPALFGGLAEFGVREVDSESQTDDSTLRLGTIRPEFDPSLAFNPESTALSVARVEGIGFGVISPGMAYSRRGESAGSIISGQAAIARFDGREPRGPRIISIHMGRQGASLAGGSRAAVFMWLDQVFEEATTASKESDDHKLLTPQGKRVIKQLLDHQGSVLVYANRAADIRDAVVYCKSHKIHPIVVGGAEAWRVSSLLSSEHVPVVLDPLVDLPESYDQIGATLENAARLHKAGVSIVFSLTAEDQAMARKLRQAAGNAVAHGLDWNAAMAAITSTPAHVFGVENEFGHLSVGQRANLVVWNADPLDLHATVMTEWLDGHEQNLTTRQTELRDRYLEKVRLHQAR